jgi:hypothetical protein
VVDEKERRHGFGWDNINAIVPRLIRLPAAFALLFAALPPAQAAGVSAYLPLDLDPELEARIEQGLVLADVPVLARPIRVATVQEALPAVCAADPGLCATLRAVLRPYQQAMGITDAGVEVAAHSGTVVPLPQQHGEASDSAWAAHLGAYARYGDHLLLSGGALAYAGRFTPTGTMASVGGELLQLDLGYREHAWSPARLNTMLMGTEAATIPSATISNVRPMTRLHLGYELFLGETSFSDRIAYQGAYTSGHPRLFGFHVEAQPLPGWSLGLSRLMQFGGGGRPSSARDLLKAFFNATKYDNTTGSLNTNQEFGNEQFSVTSSFVVPTRVPLAAYAEYAAEDTFHAENYRFGGGSLTAGLYLPKLPQGLSLRYEYSSRDAAWYVHHIYTDGLSNYGHVPGLWCADWRAVGDEVGGECQSLQVGWDRPSGTRYNATLRTAQNSRFGLQAYTRGYEAELGFARPWRSLQVGATLAGGRDAFGEHFGRLSGFARLDGAAALRRVPLPEDDAPAPGRRHSDTEYFVDLGVFSSTLKYEPDAGAVPAVKTPQGSAHLGLGVRRAYTAHSDLGARLEFDNLRGHLLTAVRALDYRYRTNGSLGVNVFVGAARYASAPTPGFGWYGGVGLQWRNIFPKWDLSLEYRRFDQNSRYKVAGEPIVIWPNTFNVATGRLLSLSRRF